MGVWQIPIADLNNLSANGPKLAFTIRAANTFIERRRTSIARFFGRLFFVFLFFAKFLATLDPNMHETKCRGARDLRVVKFSASYGPWRSQKRPKTKTYEIFPPTFFSFGRLNFHIPCGRRILLLKKEPLLHVFLHPGF